MASFANDNSEKYIPEKDVKEANLIKIPRPENLDPLKTGRLTVGDSETENEATRYCCR